MPCVTVSQKLVLRMKVRKNRRGVWRLFRLQQQTRYVVMLGSVADEQVEFRHEPLEHLVGVD